MVNLLKPLRYPASQMLGALVVWLMDVWTSGRKANSFRYWLSVEDGPPGCLEAAAGWFLVCFSLGGTAVLVFLGLASAGIATGQFRAVPVMLFLLAAIGSFTNLVTHFVRGEASKPDIWTDVFITVCALSATSLIEWLV